MNNNHKNINKNRQCNSLFNGRQLLWLSCTFQEEKGLWDTALCPSRPAADSQSAPQGAGSRPAWGRRRRSSCPCSTSSFCREWRSKSAASDCALRPRSGKDTLPPRIPRLPKERKARLWKWKTKLSLENAREARFCGRVLRGWKCRTWSRWAECRVGWVVHYWVQFRCRCHWPWCCCDGKRLLWEAAWLYKGRRRSRSIRNCSPFEEAPSE